MVFIKDLTERIDIGPVCHGCGAFHGGSAHVDGASEAG